jgi:hypothetical protein
VLEYLGPFPTTEIVTLSTFGVWSFQALMASPSVIFGLLKLLSKLVSNQRAMSFTPLIGDETVRVLAEERRNFVISWLDNNMPEMKIAMITITAEISIKEKADNRFL